VHRIRELGWPGVIGHMDRALKTQRLERMVGWVRDRIGEKRSAWLQALPMEWRQGDDIALVHAAPGDLWRGVSPKPATPG
jgi:hypothetical protein